MMVVRFTNEVLNPLIIYQKFYLLGTYMCACVKDRRLDLLGSMPDIMGYFLTMGFQYHHPSYRLADSKCLWTSFFLPTTGKTLIYVLMFMYNSGRK